MKKLSLMLLGTLTLSSSLMATDVKENIDVSKCIGCHGTNFEKVALGKSKVVKDMSYIDIATALIKYKYNDIQSPTAGIMVGQMKEYKVSDILLLSDSISKGSSNE